MALENWNSLYQSGQHLSVWPWSDLISLFVRYIPEPKERPLRVLELGCGAGANIPFFLSRNVDYFAVEGSPAMVGKLEKTFPNLKGKIACADFSRTVPFPGQFDCIVDRGSVTCNNAVAINSCLKLITQQLIAGGRYLAVDWFSSAHDDAQRGVVVDDFTRRDFPTGHLRGVGEIHFCNEARLRELLCDFALDVLDHKIVTRVVPCREKLATNPQERTGTIAFWNFVAVKK